MEPATSAASTSAISTAAVTMRIGMLERRATVRGGWSAFASATSIGDLLGPGAESAHAPLVRGERLVEVRTVKVWPERLRAVELRIRRLPEQEVAEAHFTGGANHQVRIREAPGVEVAGQAGFVELRKVRAFSRQFVDRIDDLLAAAVIDGDVEDRPPADSGSFICLAHLFLEGGGEVLEPPRESQLDPALRQLVDLAADGLREQVHQGVHFLARPRPVLRGKGI